MCWVHHILRKDTWFHAIPRRPKILELTVHRHYSNLETLVTARIKLVALSHAPTSFPRTGRGSQGDSVVASALPKNYFCLPLPPPLPNFFSFSSPSIQFSHPSSFPKVSVNSSPAVPFTPSPSPPSSIFLSSCFYPSSRYPTPPCDPSKLTSSSSSIKNHRKHGPQGTRLESHFDTALSYSHCFVQVGINGFGRIGRIVSCSPTPRPSPRAEAPSKLELTRVIRSSAMRKLTCPSPPQCPQALLGPNWPNGFLTSSQYRRWRCRGRRCQRPLH